MQAKTETHGFVQLGIPEAFCQGSTEKIIISVVQLPVGTVPPVPLVPLALSYWAALDWKVVTLGKRIWGLSCLFPWCIFAALQLSGPVGLLALEQAPAVAGRKVLTVSKSMLPCLLIPAFSQGTSPTFPGCLENRKQMKGQCDYSCHGQMV